MGFLRSKRSVHSRFLLSYIQILLDYVANWRNFVRKVSILKNSFQVVEIKAFVKCATEKIWFGCNVNKARTKKYCYVIKLEKGEQKKNSYYSILNWICSHLKFFLTLKHKYRKQKTHEFIRLDFLFSAMQISTSFLFSW